jgi:hypothetical protein
VQPGRVGTANGGKYSAIRSYGRKEAERFGRSNGCRSQESPLEVHVWAESRLAHTGLEDGPNLYQNEFIKLREFAITSIAHIRKAELRVAQEVGAQLRGRE